MFGNRASESALAAARLKLILNPMAADDVHFFSPTDHWTLHTPVPVHPATTETSF